MSAQPNGIGEGKESPPEVLRHALKLAIQRGTILHLALEKDGRTEDLYFLNTENDRRTLDKIESGELPLGPLPKGEPYSASARDFSASTQSTAVEHPNIFSLYEQNIGMLTPMIAEELKEAEKLYPEG